MILNLYDTKHHCSTCGVTFSLPAQTVHRHEAPSYKPIVSTSLFGHNNHNDSDSTNTKNLFIISHEQMISLNHGVKTFSNQQHIFNGYPTIPQQKFHMSPSVVGNGSSFANNEYAALQQRGHQQSLSLQTIQPPTPNYSRHLTNYFNDPTPNYNRLRSRMNKKQFYSDVGGAVSVKENSFGDANMHQQKPLSSVDEAKLRMENAQNAMRRNVLDRCSCSRVVIRETLDVM